MRKRLRDELQARDLMTAAVLDDVESIEYAQLREFAEILGLRRKEMLLTWPQVDFAERVIRIIGKGGRPTRQA